MSKTLKARSRRRPTDPAFIITVPGATVPSRPYPPGRHPGGDKMAVIWPDVKVPAGLEGTVLDDYLDALPAHAVEIRTEDVTRDEFTRCLAGHSVLRQVNADPLIRVVALTEADAIMRWAATRRDR